MDNFQSNKLDILMSLGIYIQQSFYYKSTLFLDSFQEFIAKEGELKFQKFRTMTVYIQTVLT